MAKDLITPETFEFFARYVLSGFLIILVANAFIFGRKPKTSEALLEIVLYSLLNQLVWFLLSSLVLWFHGLFVEVGVLLPDRLKPNANVSFYLQVLVQPVAIGWLIGLSRRNRWLHPISRALSLPIADPYPRAYDHVFAEFEGEKLVIVAFEDGKNIYGLFGYNSRASRDPEHSEIYVQQLYDVDGTGKWKASDPPKSAFINLDGVRAIEFIPLPEQEET